MVTTAFVIPKLNVDVPLMILCRVVNLAIVVKPAIQKKPLLGLAWIISYTPARANQQFHIDSASLRERIGSLALQEVTMGEFESNIKVTEMNELRTKNERLRNALQGLMDLNISGIKYGVPAKEAWDEALEALKA